MKKDTLTLCAFRYCLGRMSYIVSQMVDHLRRSWPDIHPNIQKIIKQETKEAIERDAAGMDVDRGQWEALLRFIDDIEAHDNDKAVRND